MKREFIIPELEISTFSTENIILASGIVPTNVETAQKSLTDEYKIEKQSVITL